MDMVWWIPLFTLFGGLLVAGWRYADRIDEAARRDRGVGSEGARIAPRGSRSSGAAIPRLRSTSPLVGPPVVEGGVEDTLGGVGASVPLRDWLVHFHPENRNIWSDVVTEFYTTMMADPEIADYFGESDRAALQKHFLAVVIAVTGGGVTVEVLDRLRAQHVDVRNSKGAPITRTVFDRAAGVLSDILRSKEVPEATLRQVDLVLAWLRQAIVAPSDDPAVGGPV